MSGCKIRLVMVCGVFNFFYYFVCIENFLEDYLWRTMDGMFRKV